MKKEMFEKIHDALTDRTEWERKLAQVALQRRCKDRSKQNNVPWPRASNVRYPLSDMMIEQKKPFLFQLLFASEQIATFKSLRPGAAAVAGKVAAWFDFQIKERTTFEEEIQYGMDSREQDGEAVMKTYFDPVHKKMVFEHVDNLFIITPVDAVSIEDAPWVVQVLQLYPDELRRRFNNLTGLENFIERVRSENPMLENDSGQKEKDEYSREGLTKTGKDGKVVLWEVHYKEDGRRKICTVSPDVEDFNFNDDRYYPYEFADKYECWMFTHTKRELTLKAMHSSRGIPELVEEGEHSLSAMWRNKHNAMALFNAPVYYAPNGIPGNTQNITLSPGSVLPYAIQKLDLGASPISWDQEMMNTREIYERRVATPDYGLGRSNTMGNTRTATEATNIANLQSLAVNYDTANWKRFIREVLRKAYWIMIDPLVRPSFEMTFLVGNEAAILEPNWLTDEYELVVSGSAENVNREFMVQKAVGLWQLAQQSPFANLAEIWRNVLERMEPGQVERFFQDPGQRAQNQMEKTANDITIMMLGFPVQPKMTEDHGVAAQTALQFIQAAQMKGHALTAQQVATISNYVAVHRQMLKQQDPQKYQQLTQALNQLDIQGRQQMQPGPIETQMTPA